MNRRNLLLLSGAGLVLFAAPAYATTGAKLLKDPYCGCCGLYANLLRQHGFRVEVIEVADVAAANRDAGVPADLAGCHVTYIDGYAISGHVPLAAIGRLLQERPVVTGLTLAGMPEGSPGMPGEKKGPFQVFAFTKSPTSSKLYMAI